MSSKRYPPLTPSQIETILKKHGFTKGGQRGSHLKYAGFIGGMRRVVTIDMKEKDFGPPLMKSMIKQSGLSRDEFYNTLKA